MTEASKSTYNNDKNTETGNDNKTLKEIVCEVTEQELSRFPDDTVTVEQLKAMAEKQSVRLKRRRSRIIAAAAVFFVALAGVLIAFGDFPVNVEADKNAPEEIVTEDGVVIEDGGWGSSSEDRLVITEWDEVEEAKQHIPELVIPEYIPAEFKFELFAVSGDNDLVCKYIYADNNEHKIEMHQFIHSNYYNSFNQEAYDTIINYEMGKIYLSRDDGENIATIVSNDGYIIKIWGIDNQSEITRIADGLKY